MTKQNTKMFGLMFWIHLILIITAYLSPILFNWKYILIGVILLISQYLLFNFDIFNKLQFGKEEYLTFYTKYLEYFGFRPNRKKLRIFMWYIMPFIILIIALIWQIIFDKIPLIF